MNDLSPFVSTSIEQTQQWGTSFGRSLEKNSVVAFYGTLGAGKTTLIKAIIGGLTDDPSITTASPTFVYLNEYQVKDKLIFHFDLYRLQGAEEFVECGFEDHFYQGGICLVEWAERIDTLLPANCIKLHLKPVNITTREIIVTT